MGSRLTIRVPADYVFVRDVCSYGYFILAPNRWDPARGVLERVLALSGGPVKLTLAQPEARPGAPLRVHADRALLRTEQSEAKAALGRMLRLGEDESEIADFHRVDPRWRASGRGRLFRSPSLFEDLVKTITTCNIAWPSTVAMNQRLCTSLRTRGAFPDAEKLARTRPETLRTRCRVGYRDARIVEIARRYRDGAIDEAWLADPATPDRDVERALRALPGIGPYAAANVMQLLGRYSALPLDTESVRHARVVLAMAGEDDRALLARLRAHYAAFGRHAFRSYWFELWAFYESRQGPAHTWDPATTATAFTASRLGE